MVFLMCECAAVMDSTVGSGAFFLRFDFVDDMDFEDIAD